MNPKSITLYACLLALAILQPAGEVRAQWRHYTNTDDIRAICRRGDKLWIGTNGGVVVYDLLTGRVTAPEEIGSRLPSQSIRVITDRGGTIYIGTDRGLLMSGSTGIETYSSSSRSYFADIRRICFDSAGGLYLCTFGHGVVHLRDGRSSVITKTDSLLANKVYALYQPDEETTYYATALGLCAYTDESWVWYQAGYGLPRGEVIAIEPLDATEFYVLIRGRGIYRFNGERGRRVPLEYQFQEQDVAAIVVAPDGALWAAGRYGGLSRLQYGNWTSYNDASPEIQHAQWRCAYRDDHGDLFFGASDGLVARVRNGTLSTFRIASTLPSNAVSALEEAPENGLLIVSGGHLLQFSNGTFDPIETAGHVVSLAVSPDSVLWIATRWGLFRQADGMVRDLTPPVAGLRSYFTSLAFDSTGGLWAGSYDGKVFRYDGALWLPLGDRDELPGESVDQLVVDSRNRVWMLGRPDGLARYGGGVWELYPREQFDGDSLGTIAIDNNGRAVLCTSTSVWRFSEGAGWNVQKLPESMGYVDAFTCDSKGWLYLATVNSLHVARPDTMLAFDLPSGLRGSVPAALRVDRGGWLWIGFRESGLVRVRLSDLK